MSLFGKLTKTVLHTVSAPIDVVKDMATLGGLATGEDESYTAKKAKKIIDDFEEIGDEIDSL